jgi:hypothetical protein
MLYYKFFIKDIVPAHLTDSPAMRNFLRSLNPNFKVPSRRKLSRDIAQLGDEAKAILTSKLEKVNHVAITADSWSAHNRSFLGMTVHWCDGETLKREKAVLGIKEIIVQQTGDYLAKAMMDLLHEFGLASKAVSITTDNGANYIAAFKILLSGDAEDEQVDYRNPDCCICSTVLFILNE